MKTLGTIVFLFGVLIIGFELFGYTPEMLKWINQWSTGVDWGIKITIVIVGAAMHLIGSSFD